MTLNSELFDACFNSLKSVITKNTSNCGFDKNVIRSLRKLQKNTFLLIRQAQKDFCASAKNNKNSSQESLGLDGLKTNTILKYNETKM